MLIAAQIVTEANQSGHVWTGAITALVALVAVIVNAHSGVLRKAERLAEIAVGMRDSSERRLVEDLRDDFATSWALTQMAPAHNFARVIYYLGYGLGALAFIGWWAYSTTTQYALWTWWIYLAAIGFVGAAYSAQRRRRHLRARWIRQERSDRWIRLPQHTRLHQAIAEQCDQQEGGPRSSSLTRSTHS